MLGRVAPQRLDHLDELGGAAVRQIVAVDTGHHDMLQPQLGRGGGDMLWLERIDRARHAGLHVAEGAGPRARVAQDHHRGVLLGPAFADVRAGRLLAHRGKVELAHQPPRRVIAFADRRLDPDPVGLALALARVRCVHHRPDSDWREALASPAPTPVAIAAMTRFIDLARRLSPISRHRMAQRARAMDRACRGPKPEGDGHRLLR